MEHTKLKMLAVRVSDYRTLDRIQDTFTSYTTIDGGTLIVDCVHLSPDFWDHQLVWNETITEVFEHEFEENQVDLKLIMDWANTHSYIEFYK